MYTHFCAKKAQHGFRTALKYLFSVSTLSLALGDELNALGDSADEISAFLGGCGAGNLSEGIGISVYQNVKLCLVIRGSVIFKPELDNEELYAVAALS